jgi:hypothetical protein
MTDYKPMVILLCLLVFPIQIQAADAEKGAAEKGKQVPATTVVNAPAATVVKAPADKLSYKPPLRGAPAGRVGGGTRGATERESFSLLVLAPDHVGYTTQDQPCLYWFISKPTSYAVELTVAERKAVSPLMEKVLKGPEKAGIQSICLADHGIRLKKNVQYKWFVTLVTDADHRSKDILAGGMIELLEPSPSLAGKLKDADKGRATYIYADEGLWYDALWSITRMIDASPGNVDLRLERAALLKQVGLLEPAEFDGKQ